MEYRKIIISWKATSLHEVINLIKNLSIGKNLIDRAWIVFYWVSQNIEYDVDSFFNGNISHQTSDDVFRVSPRNKNIVTFDTDRNLAKILICTPLDVYLSYSVGHYNRSGFVQYDISRKVWQCLFRTQLNDYQTLSIYARQGQLTGSYEGAIKFGLNMPNMVQFKKFPLTYGTVTNNKCQFFEPLVEKLKRGTKVTIHCRIPCVHCVYLSYYVSSGGHSVC